MSAFLLYKLLGRELTMHMEEYIESFTKCCSNKVPDL